MIVVIKYKSEWETRLCRKLQMDRYANRGIILPKLCNFTNHEKSGKISISAPVQCQAIFNFHFKENFFGCNSYFL